MYYNLFVSLLLCSAMPVAYSTTEKTVTTFNAHLQNGWYNNDATALRSQIASCFKEAEQRFDATISANSIKALVVPHAGLEYSGAIAAAAYRLIRDADIKRIIVLAPDHSGMVSGCALPTFAQYTIPTGTILLDTHAISALLKRSANMHAHTQSSLIRENDAPFKTEHSFEIQLPFIHAVAPQATVVSLIVGHLNCAQAHTVAQQLKNIIDDKTVVIVSTDFIHYGKRFNYTPFIDFAYLRAREYNGGATRILQEGSCQHFETYLDTTGATICGASPLKILLALRKLHAFGDVSARLLAYGTSIKNDHTVLAGITNASEDFVCYSALAYTKQPLTKVPLQDLLTTYEKRALLHEAQAVLANIFTHAVPSDLEYLLYPMPSEALQKPYGAFVTLKNKDGSLRGCIGRIVTNEPLYKTVATVTRDAALNDPRFEPVSEKEYKNLSIEVSVLGLARSVATEKEIRLGIDGIIIEYEGRSALFLPEVATEQKWNVEQTLDALSDKAGIDRTLWRSGKVSFKTFQTITIST